MCCAKGMIPSLFAEIKGEMWYLLRRAAKQSIFPFQRTLKGAEMS